MLATPLSKKTWVTPTASRSGPSTSRYEATVMCVGEKHGEVRVVLQGESLDDWFLGAEP